MPQESVFVRPIRRTGSFSAPAPGSLRNLAAAIGVWSVAVVAGCRTGETHVAQERPPRYFTYEPPIHRPKAVRTADKNKGEGIAAKPLTPTLSTDGRGRKEVLPAAGERLAPARSRIAPDAPDGLVAPDAPDDVRPADFYPVRDDAPVPQVVTEEQESAPLQAQVSLNQVIYASLNRHPLIQAGLESIRQAQGNYLQKTLLPNPQLFTDAQLLPLTRPFTPTKQGGPPQADAILSYPIDWFLFGKRSAAMLSAQYAICVNQADFEELVRGRILAAALAYYDALETNELKKLAAQNLESLQQLEGITEQAVSNGGRPQVELNRVRLDVLGARQTYRTAVAAAATAEARLREVTGQGGGGPMLAAVGDLYGELNGGALPVEVAVSMAEESRPDMNSLRWQISQARANVNVEERNAKPNVTPAFGYTRQFQEQAIGFPDANSWLASLTMSLPLFDRNEGNILKAGATQREIEWRYEAAKLAVRAEVEQAIAELEAARENAQTVAEEQLDLARRVRDSIVETYQAGGRPLIDVLDAQRNYRETNRLFITSRAAYWRALYRFYAAIGKKVSSDE